MVSIIRYFIVSVVGGILFGLMDGVINANSYAQKVFSAYKPIAKTQINVPAGVIVDLVYGFLMAGLFLILYKSLPGETGLIKGLSFGVVAWFFRVAMSVASSWIMFNVPISTLAYTFFSGLAEMLILGILFGLTLKP